MDVAETGGHREEEPGWVVGGWLAGGKEQPRHAGGLAVALLSATGVQSPAMRKLAQPVNDGVTSITSTTLVPVVSNCCSAPRRLGVRIATGATVGFPLPSTQKFPMMALLVHVLRRARATDARVPSEWAIASIIN